MAGLEAFEPPDVDFRKRADTPLKSSEPYLSGEAFLDHREGGKTTEDLDYFVIGTPNLHDYRHDRACIAFLETAGPRAVLSGPR